MKFEIGELVDVTQYNESGSRDASRGRNYWPMIAPCKVVKLPDKDETCYLVEDYRGDRIWIGKHLLKKMNTQPAAAPLPTGTNTGVHAPTGGNVPTTPDLPGDVPQGFIEGIEKMWEHLPEFKAYLLAKEAKRIDSIDCINELRALLNKWEESVRK
jgi:hypothetical protein